MGTKDWKHIIFKIPLFYVKQAFPFTFMWLLFFRVSLNNLLLDCSVFLGPNFCFSLGYYCLCEKADKNSHSAGPRTCGSCPNCRYRPPFRDTTNKGSLVTWQFHNPAPEWLLGFLLHMLLSARLYKLSPTDKKRHIWDRTVSVICPAASLTKLSYVNDHSAPKGVSGCSPACQYCLYPV